MMATQGEVVRLQPGEPAGAGADRGGVGEQAGGFFLLREGRKSGSQTLFGNSLLETPFRVFVRCKAASQHADAKRSFAPCVPKREFGNELRVNELKVYRQPSRWQTVTCSPRVSQSASQPRWQTVNVWPSTPLIALSRNQVIHQNLQQSNVTRGTVCQLKVGGRPSSPNRASDRIAALLL
jgi:hypothetical protein